MHSAPLLRLPDRDECGKHSASSLIPYRAISKRTPDFRRDSVSGTVGLFYIVGRATEHAFRKGSRNGSVRNRISSAMD
jgi:hypothetical protein